MPLSFKSASASVVGLALFSLCACAPAAVEQEPGEGTEEFLGSLRAASVDPMPKVGSFELDELYGDTSNMGYDFRLAGQPVLPGKRKDFPVGTATLLNGAVASFPDGILLGQSKSILIQEGRTTEQEIAGLRVRYQQPLSMGASSVRVFRRSGGAGSFFTRGAWTRRASGSGMMLLPEEIGLSNDAEPTRYITLPAGRITEVVFPTVEIRVSLDRYDPSYPDYTSCETIKFLAGSASAREDRSVRNRDGSSAATSIAPAGKNAPVILRIYGTELAYPTEGESTIWLELSRVEVKDMEVPGPSGPVRVQGTYRIERKDASGTYRPLSCTLRTHTGVDLPAGTYRITTTARAPGGSTYTAVEEITLY